MPSLCLTFYRVNLHSSLSEHGAACYIIDLKYSLMLKLE